MAMDTMSKELEAMREIDSRRKMVYANAYYELTCASNYMRALINDEKLTEFQREQLRKTVAVADSCYKDIKTLERQYEVHQLAFEQAMYAIENPMG